MRERYKVLVMGLHPDKVGGGAAATEAFGLLHSASRDEQCTFFGQDVLEEVERQQEATASAVTDFLAAMVL